MREFLQGLRERGYVEGRNVAIEFRWADGQNERLPALAAELVQRQVALITANGAAALAAKAATTAIPIVFYTGGDPVQIGLVPSLNRPGGNITGVTDLNVGVRSKRLELLRELVPTATTIGVLVNPANRTRAETVVRELEGPAQALQLKLHVLNAGNDRDLDAAFESLAQLRLSGLVVGADAFFASRSKRLGELATRHGVPAIFAYREFDASCSHSGPRDPQGIGQFSAVHAVAPSLALDVSPINASEPGELERAISAFAHTPNSGLIVSGSNFAITHRELIIKLAHQHKLPTIYPLRFFAAAGGLIAYAPNAIDPHRRAAAYVDRILKGEKPTDLPVQAPTKYELVINLKTAKALGLTIPQSLLATADEVIE